MKNYFSFWQMLFVFLFLFLPSKQVQATHMTGGEIQWTALGSHRYSVTITSYRDCRGVGSVANRQLTIQCASPLQFYVSVPRVSIEDITPVCNDSTLPCVANSMGPKQGMEKHVYNAIIDFSSGVLASLRSSGCCRFNLSFQECCRNGALTTNNGGNFFIDAEIDLCNIDSSSRPGFDNSPEFTASPINFVCCNIPSYFSNGTLEKDGDSLVYSLVPAQIGLGTNSTYRTPFHPVTWPMTGACRVGVWPPCACRNPNSPYPEGFCFNPQNGNMVFVPVDCSEVGIFVIKVEQWRRKASNNNWVYIGHVKREVQVWVNSCMGNNPPRITTNELTNFIFCPGVETCYEIEAEDLVFTSGSTNQNWIDTIALTWNEALPGAIFTLSNHDTFHRNSEVFMSRKGKLCWTPGVQDIKEQANFFTVFARDKACPMNATSSKTFRAFVPVGDTLKINQELELNICGNEHVFKLLPNTTAYNLNNYGFKTTVSPLSDPDSVVLTFDSVYNTFGFTKNGEYIFKTEFSAKSGIDICGKVQIDTFTLYPNDSFQNSFEARFVMNSPSIQCLKSNSFSFSDSSKKHPIPISKWTWFMNNDSISNDSTPGAFSFNKEGIHGISLKITYDNGCVFKTDTQQIRIEKVTADARLTQSDARCFRSQAFRLHHLAKSNFGIVNRFWESSESHSHSDSIFTVSFANIGSHTVSHIVEGTYGCKDTSTVNLTVHPHPNSDFSLSASEVCRLDTLLVTNNSSIASGTINGTTWTFGEGPAVNLFQPNPIVYNVANTYHIRLINFSNHFCRDTIIKPILVNRLPLVSITVNSATQCFPGHSFALGSTASVLGGTIDSLRWNLGDGTTSPLASFPKTYADTGVYNINLTAYTNKGCKASSSRTLTALNKIATAFTVNQNNQCLPNNFFEFTDVSSAITTDNKIWAFGDGTFSTSVNATKKYTAAGTYEVSLITNRFSQCSDTFKRTVSVSLKPIAGAITGPSNPVNNGGGSFMYFTNAQANHFYTWWLSGGQVVSGQNTRLVSVIWSDSGNQVIQYELKNLGGCSDTASLNVFVDYIGSVEDIALGNFRIYPNPVNDILQIESTHSISTIQVYDNKGALVIQTGASSTVDFTGLATGLYIVKLTDINGKVMSGKVMKE